MQPSISCGLLGQRHVPDFYSGLLASWFHAAWAGLPRPHLRNSSGNGTGDGGHL